MRNLSSIRIAEDLARELVMSYGTRKLIDTVLEDIALKILEEDEAILKTLKDEALTAYMNVELYIALEDLLEKTKEEGFYSHRPNNCPVCDKLHRIELVIDTLIADWKNIGKAEEYKDICRFRADALLPGRTLQ